MIAKTEELKEYLNRGARIVFIPQIHVHEINSVLCKTLFPSPKHLGHGAYHELTGCTAAVTLSYSSSVLVIWIYVTPLVWSSVTIISCPLYRCSIKLKHWSGNPRFLFLELQPPKVAPCLGCHVDHKGGDADLHPSGFHSPMKQDFRISSLEKQLKNLQNNK